MTLAQIKRRLTKGTIFYCTQNLRGAVCPPAARKVVIQQTNAVACAMGPDFDEARARLSWLYWPKAADVTATPEGFEVKSPHGIILRYQWEAA